MGDMPLEELADQTATYRTYRIYGRSQPPISRFDTSLLGCQSMDGCTCIWYQLSAYEQGQHRYTLKLLVDSLDFLKPEPETPEVHRYIFLPGEGPAHEYVDALTGKALLPGFQFFSNLLPHASPDDQEFPFFRVGRYLGHPVLLEGRGKRAVDLIPEWDTLKLDPHLTIGTSRNFRDPGDGRLYFPGKPDPPDRPDYERVEFDRDDYDELIGRVGMNIFTVNPVQRSMIQDHPVFFVSPLEGARIPEMLYRSNYRGATMFMDEPAVLIKELGDAKSPEEAANRLVEAIRRYAPTSHRYGRGYLSAVIQETGYDLGDMRIVEEFPVWETVTSAIWYEFKSGLRGCIHESRFQPKAFSQQVKECLGLDFPVDPIRCMDFHFAWFRGAARHFDRPWGMAIYGQMDLETARMAFQRAYDQGAQYLWFWTSDHGHHVPYDEQLEHTRRLRDHEAKHPRPPVAELLGKADVAVALPYGYLLDDWVFDNRCLWRNEEHLGLEKDNDRGATIGDVLVRAMEQALDLLGSGVTFDFVYWGGGEEIGGYREIRKVDEAAEVEVCRSC
jgi:hypothetical protein